MVISDRGPVRGVVASAKENKHVIIIDGVFIANKEPFIFQSSACHYRA